MATSQHSHTQPANPKGQSSQTVGNCTGQLVKKGNSERNLPSVCIVETRSTFEQDAH